MPDAVRWEDDTGRTRWQPRLSSAGQLLWRDGWAGGAPTWSSIRSRWMSPVLCRWRWYARWKAHREERRHAQIFRPACDPDDA